METIPREELLELSARYERTKWPGRVPVLTPALMTIGTFRKLDGPEGVQCCAMGWALALIPHRPSDLPGVSIEKYVLIELCIFEIDSDYRSRDGDFCPTKWNDLCGYPKGLSHRVANLALALFGYTEGNPEAKLAAQVAQSVYSGTRFKGLDQKDFRHLRRALRKYCPFPLA